LIDFIYWTINPEKGEALAEVKAFHLEKLPIKQITPDEQKPFIEIVDEILARKRAGEDTSALEAQIDEMVFDLYGLSADERAIVEGKM
jgi:adenine-specific DNA-methyltransferase